MKTFRTIVDYKINNHLEDMCEAYFAQGSSMILDGAPCFAKGEEFTHGKLIRVIVHLIMTKKENGKKVDNWIKRLVDIMDKTLNESLNTFGIMEILYSLHELKELGLYEELVCENLEERCREKLHWNVFIHEESLDFRRERANNYYGVAFRIAMVREYFGWDTKSYSHVFLERIFRNTSLNTEARYYMDETKGSGRYDKYSFTIASELVEPYLLLNLPLPERVVELHKETTRLMVHQADLLGTGYYYGRSIGANATGALLEIMPQALILGHDFDEDLLITIALSAAKRMSEFWLDPKRACFNLWDDGRQTDNYRGKQRVFDVNLDMPMKIVQADYVLKKAGFDQRQGLNDDSFLDSLQELGKEAYFPIDNVDIERGLYIRRYNKSVVVLPLIFGGKAWYLNMAYMPVPVSPDIYIGLANANDLNMIPELIDIQGESYTPLGDFKDISVKQVGGETLISYKIQEACYKNGQEPKFVKGLECLTQYRFSDTYIERKDTLKISPSMRIKKINTKVHLFSSEGESVEGGLRFRQGMVSGVSYNGASLKSIEDVSQDKQFHTPLKPLNTKLVFEELLDGRSELTQVIRLELGHY